MFGFSSQRKKVSKKLRVKKKELSLKRWRNMLYFLRPEEVYVNKKVVNCVLGRREVVIQKAGGVHGLPALN